MYILEKVTKCLSFEFLLDDDFALLLVRKIILSLGAFYKAQYFTIELENVHFETLVRIM